MVIGTGIDIIEVPRIREAANRPLFLEKLFTDSERALFTDRHMDAQTIAGAFAAKEAVAKALAVGFNGIRWTDIEISHDDLGKPFVTLYNGALERMEELSGKHMHVSISHIKELAVAQAILED